MVRPLRVSRIVAVVLVMITLMPSSGHGAAQKPNLTWQVAAPPQVSAGAALLMDTYTGQVLYEKDAFSRRDPASTTKVLTAIIALERGNLSDLVTVSRRAARTPGSTMYIREGQVYSLHDLLYGLLLRSGNDAAVAVAEHIAGSVEQFAVLMNDKAKEIGAVRSHFTNPHGLTDADHYSSAYDLALISRYAMQNPTFAEIVGTRQASLKYEKLNRDVILFNTNRLLSSLEGADGVKTGTTSAAGQCLVASATREEHPLIAVVLKAGNRWRDSTNLLEWGFQNFRLAYLGRQGEVLLRAPLKDGKSDTVPLELGSDLAVVIPQKSPVPRLEIDIPDGLKAPARRGQTVGKVIVRDGDVVTAETVLLVGEDVPKRSLWDQIWRWIRPLVKASE